MSSTKQKPTDISTQLYNNIKKMNAKEYLEQAFRLEQRINGKLMQVSALRSLAAKSTAIIRKDPVVTGGKEILMEDTIIRIVDLEREINQEIDRLVELRQEIAVMISRVENPEEQIVLEMRYLSYKKWPEIRSEMNCSKTTAFRWHQNALEEIEKIREVGTK